MKLGLLRLVSHRACDLLATEMDENSSDSVFNLYLIAKKSESVSQLYIGCSLRGGGPGVVISTPAFHARVRDLVPGLGGLKETKMFLPHPRVKVSIVGSLRDREVACSASDRQDTNFVSSVRRTVPSQSSHHPQEVLLAQFSLYVHKGGLKPDLFHFAHCDFSRRQILNMFTIWRRLIDELISLIGR